MKQATSRERKKPLKRMAMILAKGPRLHCTMGDRGLSPAHSFALPLFPSSHLLFLFPLSSCTHPLILAARGCGPHCFQASTRYRPQNRDCKGHERLPKQRRQTGLPNRRPSATQEGARDLRSQLQTRNLRLGLSPIPSRGKSHD